MRDLIRSDAVIVGGGLAGLLTAIRLARANTQVTLVDISLPQASGELGGFASFSGAKFSLPPAGMGLVPLAGSEEQLTEVINEVLRELGLDKKAIFASSDHDLTPASLKGKGSTYRQYHSILLSPDEILALVAKLKHKVSSNCAVICGNATTLTKAGSEWSLTVIGPDNGKSVTLVAPAVFYAAGRLSSDLLLKAGATLRPRKGLDVGVRFEMLSLEGLAGLRSLGADAKIIINNCRTFCLNSPGLIYRYPFQQITIPGGVVASPSVTTANVGVLLRLSEKENNLAEIVKRSTNLYAAILQASEIESRGLPFGKHAALLSDLYGHEVRERIAEFCSELGRLELINWAVPYKMHLPLIDWHWPTFAEENSHRTSLDDVYAIGDSSGHARGLLQAAVSGWLAAEEFLNV